jgi:hypothetical protein
LISRQSLGGSTPSLSRPEGDRCHRCPASSLNQMSSLGVV